MKQRVLFYLFIALCTLAAGAREKNELLKFDEFRYDFGTVADTSGPVVHEYKFVNVADEPVAVLSVSTECGCARPEYPVRPIAPGDSAVIKITYNPKGESGEVIKDIKVRYRAAKAPRSKRTVLRLSGVVVPK